MESLQGTGHAGIGDPVRRKEDDRLIVGGGCYADDLDVHGAAYAVFVRSPESVTRTLYAYGQSRERPRYSPGFVTPNSENSNGPEQRSRPGRRGPRR